MYTFKFWQEAAWAAGVAAVVVVLTSIVNTDAIDNWSTWAITLGGAVARAVAGAVLAKVVPRPGA